MVAEERPDTETLMNLLARDSFPVGDGKNFLDPDIRDFFDALFLEMGLQRSTVIRDAHISRTYGYQLMDGTRIGARDYYLSFAIAMKLDVRTAQRMLSVTNCSRLYPRIKRDAAIIFALNHGYDNDKLYDFLLELELAPLDTGME